MRLEYKSETALSAPDRSGDRVASQGKLNEPSMEAGTVVVYKKKNALDFCCDRSIDLYLQYKY